MTVVSREYYIIPMNFKNYIIELDLLFIEIKEAHFFLTVLLYQIK